eukprot:UN32331
MDYLECKANGLILLWRNTQIWTRKPNVDRKNISQIFTEFNNWDRDERGFIYRHDVEKIGMKDWKYKPGGKELTDEQKDKTLTLLLDEFENEEKIYFKYFADVWLVSFLTELTSWRETEDTQEKMKSRRTLTTRMNLHDDILKRQVAVIFHEFDKSGFGLLN